MTDDTRSSWIPCVCLCLSGRDFLSFHFVILRFQPSFNKRLIHVHVSRGSCYQICWPARGHWWPNRVGKTPSGLQDLCNQPGQARRGVGETLLRSPDINIFNIFRFSVGFRLICCWNSAVACSFTPVPGSLKRAITFWCWIFSFLLWTLIGGWLRNPKLAKKKGFAGIQMGINGRSIWKLHFNSSFRSR